MRFYWGVVFFFIVTISNGQSLKVADKANLQPIEHVAIFNLDHSKTALSNSKGEADISAFGPDDMLYFQHPSYQDYILAYNDLKDLNFSISLNKSTVNLSEYVVSASKWEQKREEVPNKISIISADEVEFLNPQTTADLLGTTNEVFIQKSQLGGGSPMIRGFAANSVLLVVDGVRMNNAIYRSGNLQNAITIDPNIIESAEVIFGPGSIIYGSDALGGVMDFHTKDIIFGDSVKPTIKTNAFLRYSSANNEKTGHIDFNYGGKKWGSLTSISYSDFDNLKMGSVYHEDYQRFDYVEREGNEDKMVRNSDPNEQIYSGYDQLNLMQKFTYKPSNTIDLTYTFHYTTSSDIPRYDRLVQYANDTTLKYAEWYYGPQIWMMHNLQLNLNKQKKIYDDARLTIAYQYSKESRHDRKFNAESLRSRTEVVDGLNLNFDLDKALSEKTVLFYGLEGMYNYVNSTADSENVNTGATSPASTRYPDGGSDYYTAALYANIKSNLSKKITLQAGLRFSQVYSISRFEDTTSFPYDEIKLSPSALNGSVGLVYRPSGSWQINSNISSGFRAPNVDDVAKVFDSEPGNVVVPNKNLQPEYAYNIDVGVIKNFGSSVKIDLTLFYTYINNIMVRRDFTIDGKDSIWYDGELSKVQAMVNVGYGNIYGGSFNFWADITDMLGFRTNITYMQGEDDQHVPIRHVSPLFGSTGIIFTARKVKLELYANYNGEISYERLTSTERDKPFIYAKDDNGDPYSPGWYTLNFKGYYQINPTFQLNFGIENILDHRYRPYSSGIVAPGRNFIIALRASF